MSTDRELLELAARAAGYGLPGEPDHDEIGRQYVDALGLWVRYPWGWEWFNPLGRDDHALRLAVKLGIELGWYARAKHAAARGVPPSGIVILIEEFGGDPYASTRRAVVRAAAEIGRAGGGG